MQGNNGKILLMVVDGLGVGANAELSNGTLQSIRKRGNCTIPTLDALSLGLEINGTIDKLGIHYLSRVVLPAYEGADSILGHMEIAGTSCNYPLSFLDKITLELEESLARFGSIQYNDSLLSINGKVFVFNNIEAHPGTTLNVLADSRAISENEWLEIANIVHNYYPGLRVIAQRGVGVNSSILEKAMQSVNTNLGRIRGVSVGGLGIYGPEYQAKHLIHECGDVESIVALTERAGVGTTLIGKTSHIFNNCCGNHFSDLKVSSVLARVTAAMAKAGSQFIFANVQDIDLAGHSQNPQHAVEVLEQIDHWLSGTLASLAPNDIFILCADHGNDPCSGHGHHTREKVPVILASRQLLTPLVLQMKSLRHIAATVADSFSLEHSQFKATPLCRRLSV